MRKQVICLSEAGWRGIRRFSLLLDRFSVPTVVCINACPIPEVREIIEPKPHISNYFFPRQLFRVLSYLLLLARVFGGQVAGIVVEKHRTLATLSPLGKIFSIPVLFLEEVDRGFRLFKGGREIKDPENVLKRVFK